MGRPITGFIGAFFRGLKEGLKPIVMPPWILEEERQRLQAQQAAREADEAGGEQEGTGDETAQEERLGPLPGASQLPGTGMPAVGALAPPPLFSAPYGPASHSLTS